MSWQQPARLGIALAGGACAAAVLLTLGTREATEPPAAPERVDPSAVIETAGASLRQWRHQAGEAAASPVRREYALEAARHLTYEDGTTRFIGGVRASVQDEEGPDFTITADEAIAAGEGEDVAFSGGVEVSVPGGFRLAAARVVLGTDSGLLTTDGPTTFARDAGLSGEGVGLTYDTSRDTLLVERDARGTLAAADGARIEFTADTITFDRGRRLLNLAGAVAILRDDDQLAAERVDVELDETAERATFIALRGQAAMRAPAGAIETMAADAIDLDYGGDGARLERVSLVGNAVVGLAAGGEAPAGREIRGAAIQVALDADEALAHLEATGGVRLALPQAGGPSFIIAAEGVEVRGEAGELHTAGFVGGVAFEEAAGGRARRVTAERLALELAGGTVALAVFTGRARLEAGALEATGPEAHYRPGNASLSLRGPAGGAPSRISGEALVVEAASIDATLDDLWMAAEGAVQTTLAAPAAGSASRLPGLLATGTAVNVSADAFVYEGEGAAVTYTGNAVLWQGETAIRGDALVLDQASGNFTATGNAQSAFRLDGAASAGAAPAIRYDEATREVSYAGLDGPVTPGPPTGGVRLSGPQGDLTAGSIVLRLADGGAVAGLGARAGVQMLLDSRTATGRGLAHDAATGTYVLEGAVGTPATLVDGCRRTEGQTLTFTAEGDRVLVDGNQEVRTRTAGTPCTEVPPP